MKNIGIPSRDSARDDLIKSIKQYTYKNKILGHTITKEELDHIISIYDHYDSNRGVASNKLKGKKLPTTLIDALEAAYDKTQEDRKLHSLRKTLFSSISLCPICGIGPPTELDHFLPRSEFKTLSIYARNLVPLCHDCNHAKLAGFGDLNNEDSRFIHAYFDILPDKQFLHADIEILDSGLSVDFTIHPDAELPRGYSKRLSSQFTKLNLNERYNREINNYITSHAITLHLQHNAGGQPFVQSFLNIQANFERGKFYRNHWRPTLLGALARDDHFTDGGFVDVLPIPENILNEIENM